MTNPDYYHEGLPYLDGFTGIYADKQAVRVDAIRADRAAIEFRGFPPSVRDELVGALGDKITVQTSDWNCGTICRAQPQEKAVRRCPGAPRLTLAIDRWHGAPQLAKIANVHTVGGIAFPGSPLAATKEELQQLAGYWPDIEKSRAEAKRLLKEAGAEGLSFELLNRNVDQPYKYNGTWVIDEWSKIGLKVTQRVLPTGPWFEALRNGNFDVGVTGNCQSVVNPLLDVQDTCRDRSTRRITANFEDQQEVELYNKMLRETDFAKQRSLMRAVREARARRPRRTRSFCCGGTGWCRTGPMSKAGRSARAITSTRIWPRSGSTNRQQCGSTRRTGSRDTCAMDTAIADDDAAWLGRWCCSVLRAAARLGRGGAETRRHA